MGKKEKGTNHELKVLHTFDVIKKDIECKLQPLFFCILTNCDTTEV